MTISKKIRTHRIAIQLVLLAFILNTTNMTLAHNISPGAPDWCLGADKSTVNKPEGHEYKSGEWPGPKDTVGAKPRQEKGATSLGTEFPGFTGRNMRARFGELKAGGHFGMHCHDDRPTVILLLSGTIEETVLVEGKPVVKTYKAGDLVAEGKGVQHWWLNTSNDESVTMITVDLANYDSARPAPPNSEDAGIWKEGAWFNLSEEFPHIGGLRGLEALSGILELQPKEKTPITNHRERPRFAFVTKGRVKEYRSDSVNPIEHKQHGYSHAVGDTWSYWENHGDEPATIFIYRFSDCDGECRPSGDTYKE